MVRHCQKCGDRHDPPTGKKCQRQAASEDRDYARDDNAAVLETMQAIQTSLATVQRRLDRLEDKPAASTPATAAGQATSGNDTAGVTATTLRHDHQLQADVRARMAELGIRDDDPDVTLGDTTTRGKSSSKKSGRSRTAEDIVVRDIDWPHFYVYRGPDRRPAGYSDLSIPEFVFGYLASLAATPETTSHGLMLDHLQELMRDAMDHPWEHVRHFHGILLHQQEMDRLDWRNEQAIQGLRSRYVFNAKQPNLTRPVQVIARCINLAPVLTTVTTRANTDSNGTSADIVIGRKRGISRIRKQNAGAK